MPKKVIVCPVCDEKIVGVIEFARHLNEAHDNYSERDKAWLEILPRISEGSDSGGSLVECTYEEEIEAQLLLSDTGHWEHNWEKHYDLQPGDIYVEAGAFWARYGRVASEKVGPTGKVILIEPSPKSAEVIRRFIKRDNVENMILIERAIDGEPGERKMIVKENPASHRLARDKSELGQYSDWLVDVQVDTIDNIFTELKLDRIDLLACDIEGAEIGLVKGAEKCLSKKLIHNVALACYHGPKISGIVMDLLKGHGYADLVYEEGTMYGHV